MSTIILSNYSTYSNYNKCGLLLKSPSTDDKKYALLCLYCRKVCLQYPAFLIHIEGHQSDQKQSIWNDCEEEEKEIPETDVKTNSSNDEDRKDFLNTDPLEETEVLLVDNCKLQNTFLPEKKVVAQSNRSDKIRTVVKKEPLEPDTNSLAENRPVDIEFVNQNAAIDDEDDLNMEDLEDKKPNVKNVLKTDNTIINDEDLFDNDYLDNEMDSDDEEYLSGDEECSKRALKKSAAAVAAKKSKVKLSDGEDIDRFMKNKTKVYAFIKAYQKQDELWDATRPPRLVNRCKKKREECCKSICNELAADHQIQLTTADVEKCIKFMRVRYIRDVRIRYNYIQNKDKEYKPLWFYDSLEFLRPTLDFIREMEEEISLTKPQLKDEQMISFIKIYNKYACLWNENDIFYNSEQKKQETLQLMLQEINSQLQLNHTLSDMQEQIDFVHRMVKKEKEKMIDFETEKKSPTDEYKSSCKFYEHIQYLFPHLGPFKCQYCPKVIFHVYTFRIHTSKHDNSKPFKCAICNYEFTQKPGYVIHLRRHTQDFPFVCKYCGKGFPCKKELMLHFQNHPEFKKEYICDICGEGFTQQKLLNWHLKAHNNIRDVICNICGKGFTNSKLLFQHRSVHSKEKSSCKLCGKAYSHYRGLSRHMAKEHGTTVAAVAAVMGGKPKKRVLTLDEIAN